MRDLLIIGAGGVGCYVAEQICTVRQWQERWRLVGFLDDDPILHGTKIGHLSVLGGSEGISAFGECSVIVAIASPTIKHQIVQKLTAVQGLEYPSLIHPTAWLSSSVKVGKGVIIYPGVNINHNAAIRDFVTINMGCTLGHHVLVNNCCTIYPNAALAGNTILETGVDFGIAACTIQNCRIGKWSRVGAGAVVIGDVPAETIVVGVPAKPLV
jgi:sugar O-acyltransferase (sialic acid O-acetyltransferase NeuD family)